MKTELKPIRSEADYKKALAAVEQLWGAKSGTPKGDRLDVLATLIDAYEAQHHPMDPPDPVEAIKFRMEQHRKRSLSISMIRRLHKRFGISAEVLIRPSRNERAA